MKRNLTLSYFISPLTQTWFWLGIWMPYYLLFTNYAGIGLIEMVGYLTITLIDIPTGAIADLLGKKKTLLLSFLFATIGNLMMGLAGNFSLLFYSVFAIGIGSALYSGTHEALIFDSLKQLKQEDFFKKVLSRIHVIDLLTLCAAGLIGSRLYVINHHLPFLLTAAATFLGFVISLFLKEPDIDTEKFSFTNYLRQTTQGFSQLFPDRQTTFFVLKLILILSFGYILKESLDMSLAIKFGLKDSQLGVVFAILPLISAGAVYLYSKRAHLLPNTLIYFLVPIIFYATTIFSPWFTLPIGLFTIVLRNFSFPILEIASSDSINRFISSKYRATALSTLNTLTALPYVATAYFIGYFIDTSSATHTITVISLVYILITLTLHLFSPKTQPAIQPTSPK